MRGFLNRTVIGLNNAPIDGKITIVPKGLRTGDSSRVVGKKCGLCYSSARGGSLSSSYLDIKRPNTRKRAHAIVPSNTRETRIGANRVCLLCRLPVVVTVVLYDARVLSIFVHGIYIAQEQLSIFINSCILFFFKDFAREKNISIYVKRGRSELRVFFFHENLSNVPV